MKSTLLESWIKFYRIVLYRSVFGGTVGPNPVKPVTSNDPQFYDGIKARAQQLVINMQPVTTPVAQATPKTVRRKAQNVTVVPVSTSTTPTLTVVADNTDTPPASPASPILKAQLSAPPKPRESTVATAISKSDIKSQVKEVSFCQLKFMIYSK